MWTTDIKVELPVFLTESGLGNLPPMTVMQVFEETVKHSSKEEALFVEKDGAWISWTWNHFHKEVLYFAKALINIGIKSYETVNILAFNSPEWYAAFIGK